jgi:hypothetical protein
MRSQRVQLRQVVVGMGGRKEDPLHAIKDSEDRMRKAVGTEVDVRRTGPCDQFVTDFD